jgi:hypothetical protein
MRPWTEIDVPEPAPLDATVEAWCRYARGQGSDAFDLASHRDGYPDRLRQIAERKLAGAPTLTENAMNRVPREHPASVIPGAGGMRRRP